MLDLQANPRGGLPFRVKTQGSGQLARTPSSQPGCRHQGAWGILAAAVSRPIRRTPAFALNLRCPGTSPGAAPPMSSKRDSELWSRCGTMREDRGGPRALPGVLVGHESRQASCPADLRHRLSGGTRRTRLLRKLRLHDAGDRLRARHHQGRSPHRAAPAGAQAARTRISHAITKPSPALGRSARNRTNNFSRRFTAPR